MVGHSPETSSKKSNTVKRVVGGLHPLEWFSQIKPMDMRSAANLSLNVVMMRKDIQLNACFVIAQWPFWEENIGELLVACPGNSRNKQ